MTHPLTMERRSEFAGRCRKPKDELWLGCVVTEVEPLVSARGYAYLRLRFDNCPYICIHGGYDEYQLSRLAHEHGRAYRKPEVGDVLHVNVSWRTCPQDVQKQYKLGAYQPVVKLELTQLFA